jgi:hypothetical protein
VEELFCLYVLSQPRMEMGEGKLEGGQRGGGRSRRGRLNFLGKIKPPQVASGSHQRELFVACWLKELLNEGRF